MRPINVVIVVVTVIESLRAFDIVYIINKGKNGLELLSILITNNSISEANLLGLRLGDRGRPAGDLARADHHLPQSAAPGGRRMTATAATPTTATATPDPSVRDPLAARRCSTCS